MFYYSDDGWFSNSKIEAIKKYKNGSKVNFYYYDDVFSKINWNIEPPLSLQEYYEEHATKIRNDYDKVILCFSGGFDSTQILETFHYNNIILDKIVTIGSFSQDINTISDSNNNLEAYQNAFPLINKFGLSEKFEVIDYVEKFKDFRSFKIYQYGNSWIDETSTWASPYHIFWKHLEEHVVPFNWRDKKVAIIMGKERIAITLFNDKLGVYFNDKMFTCHGNSMGNEYATRINFYSDPSYTLIQQKQAHIIHKIYNNYTQNLNLSKEESLRRITKLINNVPRTENGFVSPLYNIRNNIAYKSPKNPGIFSKRDNFLLREKNSVIADFYKMGLSYMYESVGNCESISFKSKPYFIN